MKITDFEVCTVQVSTGQVRYKAFTQKGWFRKPSRRTAYSSEGRIWVYDDGTEASWRMCTKLRDLTFVKVTLGEV